MLNPICVEGKYNLLKTKKTVFAIWDRVFKICAGLDKNGLAGITFLGNDGVVGIYFEFSL